MGLIFVLSPNKKGMYMKSLVTLILVSFTLLINAQNIGLNVTNPSEDIHMKGDVKLVDESDNTFMRLYKDKMAFRTGNLTAPYFELDSIGIGSFASGDQVIALGKGSVAFGLKNRVLGDYSFSYGENNEVVSKFSFAGGSHHTVYDDYNTAFGYGHHLTGLYNFLGGFNNNSSGIATTVFGASNSSTSDLSFSSGQGLIANSFSSIFLGSYNTEYTNTSKTIWNPNDPLLVIGNGTYSSGRNNAFVVMKNGKIGIDVDQPTEQLDVNGNIKSSGNFIGDGSQLTNVPYNGPWSTTNSTLYTTTNKVAIGTNSTSKDLSVVGDNGILMKYNNPASSHVQGLHFQMLSPSQGATSTSGVSGLFVDLKVNNALSIGSNVYVEGKTASKNQIGYAASVDGLGNTKYGAIIDVRDSGSRNIAGNFTVKDGTVENIAVKAIANGNFSHTVAIHGEALGLGSLAGNFIGDVEMSDDLEVTDLTTTSRLKVGPGNTSYFQSMQGGTFIVGADNSANDQLATDGIKVISVTFPASFPSAPRLIVTPSTQLGQVYNDAFSVTTRSVTTTGCVLIVKRLDSDYEWAQNLRVDWFGFSL